MRRKFSAYLQIYNDWSILPYALATLRGRVDELVVVDGAYDWMVPYLTETGRNPERSDQRVYDALDASGIPYRAIQRTWPNQLVKRMTGYAACTHDLVFRVDADELYFFDDAAFEAALSAGAAVACMDMPLYLAPGKLLGDRNSPTNTYQCFLFDRTRITPEVHLNYLWLVLHSDRLPDNGRRPLPIYETPVAFNAHLSTWRTADTSSNRTGYYVTNWMRANGVPWLKSLARKPLEDFSKLFSLVRPSDFLRILETHIVSLGTVELEHKDIVVSSHVPAEREAAFVGLYDTFLESLVSLNKRISTRRQPFVPGQSFHLDISTPASRAVLLHDNVLCLETEDDITQASTAVLTLNAATSTNERFELMFRRDKKRLYIEVPTLNRPEILRQALAIEIRTSGSAEVQHLGVVNNF